MVWKSRKKNALVDLTFNVKTSSLSKTNSPGLHAAIAAGNYKGIGSNLTYTQSDNNSFNSGLVARSANRTAIFNSGNYSEGLNRFRGVQRRLRRR